MKKLFTCLLFIIISNLTHAQYVTIPDSNFVNFLTSKYPNCMNGNQMDTTCSTITYASYLDVGNQNISNLEGIKYFDNLINLDLGLNNNIIALGALPPQLKLLKGFSPIQSLGALPSTLEKLELQGCHIKSINLPPNLIFLALSGDSLTTIDNFPSTLTNIVLIGQADAPTMSLYYR